jgi:hypothetical protein
VSNGAEIMKTIKSTSMTSTSGVTLISALTPRPRIRDERLPELDELLPAMFSP